MVNWDPGIRSAISDLEVEQREVQDTLFSVDYPLESGSGSITVATVRPETMLADTGDGRPPRRRALHAADGRGGDPPARGPPAPGHRRRLRRPEFGTGALKITPGHDPNDFEIGRKHKLEASSVIGEDGRMTEAAGARFEGLDVDDAREAVIAALREEGASPAPARTCTTCRTRSAPGAASSRSSRSSGSATWRASPAPAIAGVQDGRLRFHPERPWTSVYLDWLENIRPWCISRQLWWGHQIPVWYCDERT